MTGLPFEVFVRHRGYRLPYPLHQWHLPGEQEDRFPAEEFRPSEFDPVNLILRRIDPSGEVALAIEGTPLHVTLHEGEEQVELAAWTPPRDDRSESGEGLWGRAGLYRIRVQRGGEAWVTTIEVQPHYLTFEHLGRMCADIERMSTWVAYDILPYAPVFRGRVPKIARADGGDEDPAVQFALLKVAVPETLRTLRFLSTSPHLALKPTYVATRGGAASRQDRRAMRMEERIGEREEGWSVQRTGELTYDIYENRFVKRLLLDLQRRLGQLQARLMDALDELERQEDEVRRRLRRQFGDQEERIRREEPLWTRPIRHRHSGLHSQILASGRMRDALETVLRADLLRDVRPLQGIVRPTNVLQHDPRYSRLWSIYRLLKLSDRGEPSMAHRFHRRSRPSWELYEMWTAVQVMETCMRDLRFNRVIVQSVSTGSEQDVVFMYDTPRPAVIRLAHETESLHVEVIYGGFIPMSEQALMRHYGAGSMPPAGPANGHVSYPPDMTGTQNPAEAKDLAEPEGPPEAVSPVDSEGPPEAVSPVDAEGPLDAGGRSIADAPAGRISGYGEAMPEETVEPSPGSGATGDFSGEPILSGAEEGSTVSSRQDRSTVSSRQPDAGVHENTAHGRDGELELRPGTGDDGLLVTRGVQTAPDLQVRFIDAETDELLGVVILDAKYKGGRRIWGREGGRITDDRLNLESYLLDIHRRDCEEAVAALPSQRADDIVMGAYAVYPGERFGHDLAPEERRTLNGLLGAIRVSPESTPSEELSRLLLEAMAQAQLRRSRLQSILPAGEDLHGNDQHAPATTDGQSSGRVVSFSQWREPGD